MIHALLRRAQLARIHLWVEGDRLGYEAPTTAEADAILAEIARDKSAVMAALACQQQDDLSGGRGRELADPLAALPANEQLMIEYGRWCWETWPGGDGPLADDAAREPLWAARWSGDEGAFREAIVTDARALLGTARGRLDADLSVLGYHLCRCGRLTRQRLLCRPCGCAADEDTRDEIRDAALDDPAGLTSDQRDDGEHE